MGTDSVYGLEFFIEEVLRNRFPFESFKHKPEKTAKGLRFHCPYCGDTDSVRKTPRGNLYMKSRTFRCFNDGCFMFTSLEQFILKFSEKYGIDISDVDLSSVHAEETTNDYYNRLILTKDNNIYDYMDDMGLLSKLPHIDQLKFTLSLRDVNTVSQKSKVFEFLNNRSAYSIPNLNTRVYADNLDNKIYIMNIDDFTNKVLSMAVRSVERKSYIIQVFSDFNKYINIDTDNIEQTEFLDMISSYYNIMNVDLTKDMNVTEGQFDSMFINNHMALQGVSKLAFLLNHVKSDKINILFDRDKGGYQSLAKTIDKYGIFMWTLLIEKLKRAFYNEIPNVIKIHDINELFTFLYKMSGYKYTYNEFNDLITRYTSKDISDRFFI